MATIKNLSTSILVEPIKWFLRGNRGTAIQYRFAYGSYVRFDYQTSLQREGEQIVYRTPEKVKKLKIGGYYYRLEYMMRHLHHTKAAAICEIIKRRKSKEWLEYETKD